MNLTLKDGGASLGNSYDQRATAGGHVLGTIAYGPDGSRYRYVKAGAVALVAGTAVQAPAIEVLHLALTPSAAALGATQVVATLGAAAALANRYAEGWLQVDTTPGNGRRYRIASHAAVLSSGVITVQLYPDEGLDVALTTGSRVGLIANVYNGVIIVPQTTATGRVVGIACADLAIGYYGWVQTHGFAAPLINGNPALGATLIGVSGTTAGALDIATATTILTGQIVGNLVQIGVSGKNNGVWLTID